MTCDISTDSLRDLAEVRIYGLWAGGGPAKLLATKVEIGRECQPDSIVVDGSWGYHAWLTARDFAGHEACASNAVYFCSPCQTTGVPIGEPEDYPVDIRAYDIRGRRIARGPRAGGVYFEVTKWKSGKKTVRRILVLK